MINYTSSDVGNVKCDVQQLQTTAEFASNLTASICLLLAM